MARQLDSHLQAATLDRSQAVRKLTQCTFHVTYSHLSQLKDRTIPKFCQDKKIPYVHKFFTDNEKDIVEGNSPKEKFEVPLLYKLLKHCCGLKPHTDKVWKSEDETDTLEYLINYCWSGYNSLSEASEMTESNLNQHMDKILRALSLTIEKVEQMKNVDENDLKEELLKHIGQRVAMHNDSPVASHLYEYTILSQHAVHVMLVTVYQELNNLDGMRLSTFLNKRRINLTQRTLYSNEHKFLEGNPPPQNMPISILYRVLKRVCFDFELQRRTKIAHGLEGTINQLKKEYDTKPVNEGEYRKKGEKLYELLKTAMVDVSHKKGKEICKIIQDLPKLPYVIQSIQHPSELPNCSMPSVSSSPPQRPHSPMDISDVPTTPTRLASSVQTPSQTMVTASSSSSGLKQEEINVAVLFKVLCPGGLAVETLALVFKALKGNVQNAKTTGKKYKDNFTKDEREALEEYMRNSSIDGLSNMDLTLLCKLLRTGCLRSLSQADADWNTEGDTLECYITIIRKERNKLSHDVSTIETSLLNKALQNIETALNNILERTEDKVGKNDHDVKKELVDQKTKVKDEMQKVATCYPINSYFMSMEGMRKCMASTTKHKASSELQQMALYRENLLYMSPLSGSDDATQFLTTKEVYVDRELEDTSNIETGVSYRIKDVLFCQDKVFASSRVIIIDGRPGEGKTSLCKYAYHLWSEGLNEASQMGVDLLIYIPCRYVTTKSISAYLKERLPNTFTDVDKDDIIPLMQEPGIVFVIDGYDEAGGEAKSLIDDILTSLPDSRLIITTKTQWVQKLVNTVKYKTSHYKRLSMIEVTDDMRQEFIRKIFKVLGKDDGKRSRLLAYLNEVKDKIFTLINCPLTFCLLTLLWSKEPENIKKIQTSTQLYHKLNELILQRVSDKLVKNKFYCDEWMITLGEIAWKNLKNNQHHLNSDDLTTLNNKALDKTLTADDNKCLLSNLLRYDTHSNGVEDVKTWNFMHNSQQEYFAAVYIEESFKREHSSLSKILDLPEEVDEKYKKKLQRLVPLIDFVCGLLQIHEGLNKARVMEIVEIMSVIEPWAFIAVRNMFKPILQEKEVEKVVKTLFKNQTVETFENYDPECVLWVLKHTSLSVPTRITFRNQAFQLESMVPLLKFLNTPQHIVKVLLDVDRPWPNKDQFTIPTIMNNKELFGIVFSFMAWKPLLLTKMVQDWLWFTPLRLTLHPELYHLVWWELLISLLSLKREVSNIAYSSKDKTLKDLVEEGANWLNSKHSSDETLESTEVVISSKMKR